MIVSRDRDKQEGDRKIRFNALNANELIYQALGA